MNAHDASFRPQSNLDDQAAAEQKLCRLFKSFGIDAQLERGRLIDPYLDRAADFWRLHTGADFAALALQEAEADLEAWFTTLLGERLENRDAAVMTGRAAFLMCGGPARFRDQFLRAIDDLDDTFVEAMIDQAPSAVPPSELGEMHHQPYAAWSPTAMMARALPPIERVAGLAWRNTGTTS